MQVLLIRPPRREAGDMGLSVPPLGLAYIAASLIKEGHTVEILDAYAQRWSWSQFEQHMSSVQCDVIGFSAMTPTMDVVQRALPMVRQSARWIILGGPHPTAVREQVFVQMPLLDAAVVGEGEDIAVNLLSWFEGKARFPDGVLHREHSFREASPPDVRALAFPARHLLPQSSYRYLFATRRGFATMITSRGCPFRCSFCDKSVGGSRWRARTAVDVVNELEMLEQQGIGFVNFYDDNFTLHPRRVEDICNEILKRGLKIEWKCEGRVDSVDVELLTLMKRAGCRVIAYGVESGNSAALEFLRKDINIEQTQSAFVATHKAGIRTLAYMILGVPGETEQDVRNSIWFADKKLRASYAQFSSLNAMPGTPIYGHPATKSVKNPVDSDRHRATVTDLSELQLKRLLKEAWVRFYLNPKRLGRLGLDVWRSGSFDEGARLALAMGKWSVYG
ncbi:MAG: hypothetical protein CMK59_03400 [Proteobacteria bacterium]|nr:hypothetical protein [Pseudomonadota bacterium]